MRINTPKRGKAAARQAMVIGSVHEILLPRSKPTKAFETAMRSKIAPRMSILLNLDIQNPWLCLGRFKNC